LCVEVEGARLEMEVLGCYCLPNPKTQYYQRSNSSISANTAETQIGGINGKIATPNWEGKNERRLMRRVDGYEGRVLDVGLDLKATAAPPPYRCRCFEGILWCHM
jgi:hypothetical protein